MSDDEKALSTDEARAALEADRQRRTALCMREVQAVLEKYRCKLQFVRIEVNGQTAQAEHRIVAEA